MNNINHITAERVNIILPMRAGSQRIVNKNIRLLNDRPLYEYIIDTLLRSKHINKIVISTDIEEVLNRYKNNEKFIIFERSKELKGNINMNRVIEDILKLVEGEHFMQLHATTPLLTSETIDMAIEKYFSHLDNYDSLFSVNEKQMRYFDKDWKPINHKLEDAPMTQDLEIWYEENSLFYLFSKNLFNKRKHRVGEKPFLFKTPLLESIDLDTEEHFQIAELLLKGKSVK